ncbi:transposase, fragment, partial (plasmid) [Aromatoleum aromaticum EbN1]
GRLMCRSCRHQTSVTTETIFEKTRTPLRVWLAGAWDATNQKLGVSALGLQRVLVNADLKLTRFPGGCRFKTDTPLSH